jgi:3-phenylpropionate/trans-cinnamate dioxygenase ferredoxin subunit
MDSTTLSSQAVCLGPIADLPEGSRRIVKVGSVTVGVFNVKGTYYAIRDYCPHEGAALCQGKLSGTNAPTDRCGEYKWGQEGTILRCPWHGWEFDIITGEALFDPRLRVKTYAVSTRNGEIWVEPKRKESDAL